MINMANFFRASTANAEIERLEKALKAEQDKNAEILANEPEALKLAEEALAESDGKRVTAETALAAIKTELATAIAERDAAKVKAVGVAEEVKIKAAAAAAAIVAGQGASPAPATADATPAGNDILAELEAITDPIKRSAFIQKNKAALFAAGNKK